MKNRAEDIDEYYNTDSKDHFSGHRTCFIHTEQWVTNSDYK